MSGLFYLYEALGTALILPLLIAVICGIEALYRKIRARAS